MDILTSKPKALQDIYTQNTGKRSEKIDHTGHFLEHGKMTDGSKKELSDILKTNKKEYVDLGSKVFIINPYYKKYSDLKNEKINKEAIIDKYEKIDIYDEKILECINYLSYTCQKFGINVTRAVADGDFYFVDIKDINTDSGGTSEVISRTIKINKSNKLYDYDLRHAFIHEFCHHICELSFMHGNNSYGLLTGYGSAKSEGSFLTEGFTDLLTEKTLDNIYKNNSDYNKNSLFDNIGYPFQKISIAKLIDLASKKLNKSPEYIYNYMMRGYLIKGYKGLNIFYQAFGRDFIKGFMNLGTDESSVVKFIELVKNNYYKLGFEDGNEAIDYFDPNNKPSKEIGDIMGIER